MTGMTYSNQPDSFDEVSLQSLSMKWGLHI